MFEIKVLCKPAMILALVSAAGAIYHLLSGNGRSVIWWLVVGVIGTATFQGLCMGGMSEIAWIVMSIPVLLVCFFLAVALFSSSIRIQEKDRRDDRHERDECGRCGGERQHCGCQPQCEFC
jgi:uncharacterized membrane protein